MRSAGDFFGTTAEVHPAEFIQLACRWSISRSRLLSFSCRAWIALPVRPGAVSAGRCRQKRCLHKPVFYRAYSVTTRIKRFTHGHGGQQPLGLSPVDTFQQHASCACVRNTLPSRADGQAKPHAPAVWSGGTVRHRWTTAVNLTAAAAPENENMAGHGIVFSAVCTFAARPLKPFLISVIRQPAKFWSRKVTGSSLQFLYSRVRSFSLTLPLKRSVPCRKLPHS